MDFFSFCEYVYFIEGEIERREVELGSLMQSLWLVIEIRFFLRSWFSAIKCIFI